MTTTDRTLVQAAATERGWRTLMQGLGLDLAVAAAVVLLAWLPTADLSDRAAWLILGTSLAKSVLTALASYVMRLKRPPAREVTGRTTATRVAGVVVNDEAGRVDGTLIAAIFLGVLAAWVAVQLLTVLIR